jgi:transposase
MKASPSTLLRYVRGSPEVAHPLPTAVGIDDWAFRRGRRYGTMIVDLERHEVIDLIEDREAGAVRAWLERHPQIRIVARDRVGAYAEAATKGTPQAAQVADRWHLMHNLVGALEEFLLHKKKVLREAARTETAKATSSGRSGLTSTPETGKWTTRASYAILQAPARTPPGFCHPDPRYLRTVCGAV